MKKGNMPGPHHPVDTKAKEKEERKFLQDLEGMGWIVIGRNGKI